MNTMYICILPPWSNCGRRLSVFVSKDTCRMLKVVNLWNRLQATQLCSNHLRVRASNYNICVFEFNNQFFDKVKGQFHQLNVWIRLMDIGRKQFMNLSHAFEVQTSSVTKRTFLLKETFLYINMDYTFWIFVKGTFDSEHSTEKFHWT